MTRQAVMTTDLVFTGNARRILGDFSNATLINRPAFQSSVTNDGTPVYILPNGTSRASGIYVWNTSNPTNSGYGGLGIDANALTIGTGNTGTGTLLPVTFAMQGVERGRLDATSSAWSAPSALRLNSNTYYDGTNWNRYDTVNPLFHVNVGQGIIDMYTAVAGIGAPAWTHRFGINAAGAVVVDQTLTVGSTLTVSGASTITGRVVVNGPNTSGIATATPYLDTLEIMPSGGGASVVGFHRPGAFAAYLGIDTDNIWKVGGWSMGAAAYRIILGDGFTNNGNIRATYLYTTDGGNGIVQALNGDLYVRSASASNVVRVDTATLLAVTGRLTVGAYDPAWAFSVAGNGIASGRFYQQNNGGWYCMDVSDVSAANTGNKIVQRVSEGSIVIGDARMAGIAAAYGSYDGATFYSHLSPNIGDWRGQGKAHTWFTWACVDHADQFGLRVESLSDPLGKVRAIRAYSYDHLNFEPGVPNRPMRGARDALRTTPAIGFRASDVAEHFPELVTHNPASGVADGVDLGRMAAVLWEAFQQYVEQTDARIQALEAA